MKFEELTNIWHSTDMALDQSIKINRDLVKSLGLSKVKSKLSGIKWTSIFEIVVGIWFADLLAGFLRANLNDPWFAIPALSLLVITGFSLAIDILKLVRLLSIDPGESVVHAQKRLASLKKLEILDTYSLLVIIPLFSAPFLIVAAKGLIGLNLYDFGTQWIVSYVAGSAVVAVIIVFFLARYPNKELTEAIAFLNELKEGEK